jgi:lysophospholipase L1-like esterase
MNLKQLFAVSVALCIGGLVACNGASPEEAETGSGTGGRSPTGGASSTNAGQPSAGVGAGGLAALGDSQGVGGASVSGGVSSLGGRPTAGGTATGGSSTGGRTTGGSATGGKATGGSSTGGSATGGSATGGTTTTTKVTVYLAGDSTVQTYSASQAPQQGWGQRLQEFFTSNVVIVNKAIGGRSSKSFVDEGRLTEILNLIQAGDYLFAQWGINDRYTSDATRYTDPATTFRTYLKMYIDGARSKNALPVLITPTPRLDYSGGVFHNDFPAYCEAIIAVGLETNTPVIDLQTKGLAYYTSVGYDYVSTTISLDVLHFKTEGAYQMARLVAEGVKELNLSISPYVK